MQAPGFWDDQETATKVSSQHARASRKLQTFRSLESDIEDLEALEEMAAEDDSIAAELEEQRASIESRLDELEEQRLFAGRYDSGDAIVSVHAGAGGTDSQDWAEMLLRMEMRWAERRGFKVELAEASAGEEAGIKSASFIVHGDNAYGLYSAEKGVHRLVRISPFDAQARRHTAFASFEAVPFLEEASEEVEIDEKDLRIDTYRSSGAGGQHVNVTDSAVRITHLPTGIVVSCQNQRSQHQNKDVAMKILAAKLAERAREERRREMEALAGEQRDVAWGSQIRSYVLHPYQMVKDLRTDYEVGNIGAVLDGDLDGFMESWLRWRQRQRA
jgi:peptide chain release factor 2